MVFLVLVKEIPNEWVSSPLMEDQWVNWESNLYVRVVRCKFNVLMIILRERHLQHSTLQLNKG